MSVLDVQELSVSFAANRAVDGLSFSLQPGESVGLVGESGSGKTQTALAIMGLSPAEADVTGRIRLNDQDISDASELQLNALRTRQMAMVFQDPLQSLNPYLRVEQQLRYIVNAHGLAPAGSAGERVRDMLSRVRLTDIERVASAYPHQLSGGMRQRVMLAAALMAGPSLLIADEPTTALDVTVQAQILELLAELRAETSLLLITHDLGVVARHCERLLVIEDGRLIESGKTASVFSSPQQAHTRALLDAAPRIDSDPVPSDEGVKEERLSIDSLSVSYRAPGGSLAALRELSLSLRRGETVAVVGESGSGKSTLARAVLGLLQPSGGDVRLAGTVLPMSVDDRPASVRRDLQLVFQDPVASLNPRLRCRDIVAEPLTVHSPGLGAAARQERALQALSEVGLNASFGGRRVHELSGGQAQRVALARALVIEPAVLVCDEAVAALDGTVRKQVLGLLQERQAKTGLSLLFITHDLAVAKTLSHRVAVMYAGALVELATSRALFASPRHPYTRTLLDAVVRPDPARPGGIAAHGDTASLSTPGQGCRFYPRCSFAQDRCRQAEPAFESAGKTGVACYRSDEIAADLTVERIAEH